MESYAIHHYHNGEDTVVAEDLPRTWYTNLLKEGIFIYEKRIGNIQVPISSIDGLDSVDDLIYAYIEPIVDFGMIIDGKESVCDLEGYNEYSGFETYGDNGVISTNFADIYYIYNIDGGVLKRVAKFDGCGCVSAVWWDKSGKEVLYYLTDLDGDEGDLYRWDNGESTWVASDIESADIFDDGSVCLDQYNNDELVLTYVDENGEATKLGDKVFYKYSYLGDGELLYIDDSTLMYFDGKEIRKMKDKVSYFWVPDEEDGTSICRQLLW